MTKQKPGDFLLNGSAAEIEELGGRLLEILNARIVDLRSQRMRGGRTEGQAAMLEHLQHFEASLDEALEDWHGNVQIIDKSYNCDGSPRCEDEAE